MPNATPDLVGNLAKDRRLAVEAWAAIRADIEKLPPRPERTLAQQKLADELLADGRDLRDRFLTLHLPAIYDELTDGLEENLRAAELVYRASEVVPGLAPTREQITGERQFSQGEKEGWEIDHGVLLSHVLSDRRAAFHLIHAMTQPLPEAHRLLPEFRRTGHLDLGPIAVERHGNYGVVSTQNRHYLNAEDDESSRAMETAADLLLLDDNVDVCVLRGGRAVHPKYAGRRVFDSGINLTRLYYGQISFVEFLIERELGLLNKFFRGHSAGSPAPGEVEERHEKPWVAAVETFAIGGGCQYLLVMDRVIAERDSYFNLPALKEGFIPGCGNLRLPRFVGERAARQGIFFNRDYHADTTLGRMIADDVVDDEAGMDSAIEESVEGLTATGAVGIHANRKAVRIGAEPIDVFRRYMANYARSQARCMYSQEIIANIRQVWNPESRTLVAPTAK
jgi:(3,5-dihydroxyphenyl)acetyl-CoA 1,2-dioxygenase